MSRLSDIIKSKRNEMSFSQQDLANLLGISRVAISRYESGTREPDYETLNKLAEIFAVSTDFLLGRTDDPVPYRDVNEDLHDGSAEEELRELLADPDLMLAFNDYGSWSEAEKRALINFIKGQKLLKNEGK